MNVRMNGLKIIRSIKTEIKHLEKEKDVFLAITRERREFIYLFIYILKNFLDHSVTKDSQKLPTVHSKCTF